MKKKSNIEKFKQFLPYIIAGVATLALVFVGSIDKHNSNENTSLSTFATEESNVSVDQMSELYMVADLSDALGLASAQEVASNYVTATSMYNSGQTTVGKTEKPNLTNVAASRGVIEHIVEEGENVDIIAAKYSISPEQVRWSNGLRTGEVTAGTTLKIPSTPGIVYVVKPGDTLESIVERYGSSASEIIALNDLEFSGVTEGMQIVIKNGTLPANERPEYSAPSRTSSNSSYAYTYLGNSYERQGIQVVGWFYNLGGPYIGGQCTQWAWSKRPDLPPFLGNAGAWASGARAAGFLVNNRPSAGAIFQTGGGWYGHVGYVESVNSDGSIIVSEMNYGGVPYRVIRSTIPADAVGRFNYIH